MASEEQNMPFIRNLASSDRKIRTSALSSLRSFLSGRHTATSPLTPLEILKLWKGLFYALWMCDRAVPQQALCDELAGLLVDGTIPRSGGDAQNEGPATAWLRGFWATMAREWASIDVYRLNKFMLLVRRVIGASFQWMRSAENEKTKTTWHPARTEAMLNLLAAWPFALEDEALEDEVAARREENRTRGLGALAPPAVPVGLKLHVLDVWVDEAEKAGLLEEEENAQTREIVTRLVAMVDELERRTTYPAIRVRAKESLADERLAGRPASAANTNGDEAMDDGSWDGFED